MEKINNRRVFIEKLGLFSTMCLTGISESLASLTYPGTSKGLIIKADDGEVRYIGNTRKAKVVIKISKTPNHAPEMSLLSELITPGDGIPVHKHLNEDEFLFVQKGRVEITLGERSEMGEPGDLIYVPKGTWHGFMNMSEEDAVMFFGYSPSGFEDYFRKIGTTNINEDLGFSNEDWIRANKEFGVIYRT